MKFNTKSAEKLLRKLERAARSHSPEIKLAAGIASIAVATVLYCKGAVKAEDVKKDFNQQRDTVAKMKTSLEQGDVVTKTEAGGEEKIVDMSDIRYEMGMTYRKAAIGLLKCYLLPTGVMIAGVTLIILSHGQLRGQNAALNAALGSSMAAYEKLRNDIRTKYGPEVENELVNGITQREITTTTIDEKGKKTKTKETISELTGELGTYCLEFSPETNRNFDESNEYNLMFINGVMKTEEQKIHIHGSNCLNNIIVALGYNPKKYKKPEGYALGWYIDPEDEEAACIDYTLHEVTDSYSPLAEMDSVPRRKTYIIEFKNLKPLYGNPEKAA